MEQSPAVDWSTLPEEIRITITRNAGNSPAEIVVAIRSVCQWWRLLIPPPPNKLSAIFPLHTPVYPVEPNSGLQFAFYASAVYLVRPCSDPSGPACLVSVEEVSPGNLVLRDPLVFKKVFPLPPPIDPDWIVDTQTLVSRSFASYYNCCHCDTVLMINRMVYVLYSGFGCRGLVGVCQSSVGFFVFTDVIGNTSTSSKAIRHRLHSEIKIWGGDLVAFDGHILVVDRKGRVYVLDHTSLDLMHLSSVALPEQVEEHGFRPELHFVVSDGDLYLVVVCHDLHLCETYRLVINADDDREDDWISSLVLEQVEDLGGDRVFFVTRKGNFSVSARDLPPPWKGNCVVVRFVSFGTLCECEPYKTRKLKHTIFFLGGGQKPRSATISSLPGYSDLLSPGRLLVQIKDLDLGQDADITAA